MYIQVLYHIFHLLSFFPPSLSPFLSDTHRGLDGFPQGTQWLVLPQLCKEVIVILTDLVTTTTEYILTCVCVCVCDVICAIDGKPSTMRSRLFKFNYALEYSRIKVQNSCIYM